MGCSKTNVCVYFGVRTSRTPGVSLSTRKTVAFAGSPSTCACTRKKSATSPLVTCHFSPSRTHASPSRRAVVATIVTSEPAPSSVIAYASRRSPRHAGRRNRSFCSSVPAASGIDGRQGISQSAFVTRPHCSSISMTWNVS
jgi:hypothetical protein